MRRPYIVCDKLKWSWLIFHCLHKKSMLYITIYEDIWLQVMMIVKHLQDGLYIFVIVPWFTVCWEFIFNCHTCNKPVITYLTVKYVNHKSFCDWIHFNQHLIRSRFIEIVKSHWEIRKSLFLASKINTAATWKTFSWIMCSSA